eukprot:scaffold93720_cov33-Phaeocystis_antarctica.AAC.1
MSLSNPNGSTGAAATEAGVGGGAGAAAGGAGSGGGGFLMTSRHLVRSSAALAMRASSECLLRSSLIALPTPVDLRRSRVMRMLPSSRSIERRGSTGWLESGSAVACCMTAVMALTRFSTRRAPTLIGAYPPCRREGSPLVLAAG